MGSSDQGRKRSKPAKTDAESLSDSSNNDSGGNETKAGERARPEQDRIFGTSREGTNRQQMDQDTPVRSETSRGTSGVSTMAITSVEGAGSGNVQRTEDTNIQFNQNWSIRGIVRQRMREDPNVDNRSLWELLIERYNHNPRSQEFAGLECSYEALSTDAGEISPHIIPGILRNSVGITFPDEASRNEALMTMSPMYRVDYQAHEAQYCCIAARDLTDGINEIYGQYD